MLTNVSNDSLSPILGWYRTLRYTALALPPVTIYPNSAGHVARKLPTEVANGGHLRLSCVDDSISAS